MKEFWNEKFNTTEYIYGKSPNIYLAEKLKQLQVGKILFAAEGEGRNAVFAAVAGAGPTLPPVITTAVSVSATIVKPSPASPQPCSATSRSATLRVPEVQL